MSTGEYYKMRIHDPSGITISFSTAVIQALLYIDQYPVRRRHITLPKRNLKAGHIWITLLVLFGYLSVSFSSLWVWVGGASQALLGRRWFGAR
jgi:hypothetical protein